MKRITPTLVLIPLVVACSAQEPPPPPPRPAVVTTIRSADAGAMAAYAGEVRARHEADLGFRIGGKVVERPVSPGDRVRKGQLLARIDPADAALSAAAGQAQLAAAEAELALAKAEYERAQSLAERKFISGTAVDTRKAQWQAATARVHQARAQAGVSGNQLAYTSLVADRDGVVTAAPVDTGQVVAPGQIVVRLADPAEREILIHVPESRIARFGRGQSALVRPWNAQEQTLAGTVREIAGTADVATRTFAVRVSVGGLNAAAGPGGDPLPLGSTAGVAFPEAVRDSIVLPRTALVQRDGKPQVWVLGADARVVARPVEADAFRDDGVRIRAGLADGDRVVVVGAAALSPGMMIRPIDERAAPALDQGR